MKGQAILPLVLLIGGVILVAGVAIAFATLSYVNTSYGVRAAQSAEVGATAGIEDALLQLSRNSSFSNTSGYTISVGSTTATVTVTQNSPIGYITIVSSDVVSGHTKKIQAVVSENPITEQVNLDSWQEIQ